MQQYLQVADFQSVEKQSAPRSKFVKVVLRVSVSMMSVPNSFRRSRGKAGKTRLLRKEYRVDLRRKWLSIACSDGERSLLLRKECRKDLR